MPRRQRCRVVEEAGIQRSVYEVANKYLMKDLQLALVSKYLVGDLQPAFVNLSVKENSQLTLAPWMHAHKKVWPEHDGN